MEDKAYHNRPRLATLADSDYVLQMEPDSTATTPPITSTGDNKPRKNSSEVDVCYPFPTQQPDQHSTVEVSALRAFAQDEKEEDLVESGYKLERQLTAKLDDLLESNEKGSNSRRYSFYGEHVRVK